MDNNYDRNVTNPYYSILTGKDFFGGTDGIRIVIIIYILLSLILNAIIFIVIGSTIKIKKIKIQFAQWLMLGVLLMNFLHTFTYFFEWVVKKGVITQKIENDNDTIEVGALLTGNPKNIFNCKAQGFLLIFSSISQDFLINIFFYIVNSNEFNEKYAKYSVVILGLIFPFVFTLFLEIVRAIGLNDEFCYVKKIDFEIIKDNNNNEIVKYSYFDDFQVYVMIVYSIRVINFCLTVYFLKKILSYVREKKESTYYIFKSIFIPIIQLFTIGIGVIYRSLNMFSRGISVKLAGPYLILNTFDGVLFPVGFILQNNIISQIKILILRKDEEKNLIDKPNEPMEFFEKREEEDDYDE